jgi:ribosomal protein L25 (general stress protein Ctc)
MMNTPRRGYAPKITVANSLQLKESCNPCLYLKNTKNTKTTKIEAVSESLLEQDHQEKRHKVLIRDIQQESLKETLRKLLHGNSKKRPRKSPKRTNRNNISKP